MLISLELNDKIVTSEVAPNRRLIDWLREDMKLTGTKEGCGEGECGACTVLLNGQPVNSCLILIGQLNNKKVNTIEGIKTTAKGKILIDAFVSNGAVQCGFCTPGMIVASFPLLNKDQSLTIDEIKQALTGNLCRCTGYIKIVNAITEAQEKTKRSKDHE